VGNRVSVIYIRDGKIASRLFYGYIDGARVTRSDGNAGGSGSGIAAGAANAKPRDTRFGNKHLYEYQAGKLVKHTWISNDGSLWMTYTYIYREGETEQLVYDYKGKLNQKRLFRYDKDGNETGLDIFDAFKDPKKVTAKIRYTYGSFDSRGNWTQRTQFYASIKDGTEVPAPYETVYRTITYADYNPTWFAPINDPNKPDWEILPQEAKPGEVILSKRNELGILSNFAATPFDYEGKRYASVEGFWQMMLYPEGPDDQRAKDKRVTWKYTREQVAQMTAFEAKQAGTLAEENMKTLGIGWCTYQGKRFPYRSQTPGEHYRLIVAAMRAKLEQNPEVKRILLATGDLVLKPDHHGEPNPPPEWKYNEIWMQLRSEWQKPAREQGR
jgi:hypothetical protein